MELQNVRYAARQLARTPGFTLITLATLTLAIGATTAVFSIVNGILLKSLGFARPDRLVFVHSLDPKGAFESISPPDMIDYRDQTHSFMSMAAVDGNESLTLLGPSGPPERILAARVGASFFSVLGVPAQLGRTFVNGEDAKDATKVVVLSDHAWHLYFQSDPQIVGRKVSLNGQPYVVVGVAPPTFAYPEADELWYPAVWHDYEKGDNSRGFHSITAVARLRDGVSLASAQRDLAAVAARIAKAFPDNDAGVSATAESLRNRVVGDFEAPLWAMLGAVMFVLLIACANIANLQLVRASSRQTEVAVRTALGAGRRQLLQQFLVESLLLAAGGAMLGIILATAAVRFASALAPIGLPRISEVGVDGRVLVFAVIITLAAALAFGLLPGLQASGWDVAHMLRSGSRSATGRLGRTRSALVLVELVLGTVLLVGAGLLIRSFEQLMHVNLGFRSDHLIVFDASLHGEKYQYDRGVNAFADEVENRLSTLPGVAGVAVATTRPFDASPQFAASSSFTVDERPKPAPGSEPESRLLPVSPNYFRTMGMSLLRGRVFSDAENRPGAVPVVVISEALAQRYFPNEDPIGKHITFGFSHTASASPADSVRSRGEIIGIVRSPYIRSLDEPPVPATFFPYHTMPFSATFAVRTQIEPATVEREIRSVVASVDPDIATYEVETMDDALATSPSASQHRFFALLLSAFAGVALLLATLGVYGVISYSVTQQTRDFGIRVALGAQSRDIISHVLGRGTVLLVAGLGGGLVGAALLTRLIRGLLFGIEPFDATTFGLATLLFAAVATTASLIPARRAARADPLLAMRAE